MLGLYFLLGLALLGGLFCGLLVQLLLPFLSGRQGGDSVDRCIQAVGKFLLLWIARHKGQFADGVLHQLLGVGFLVFQFFPDKVLGIFAASDAMLAIGIPAMRIICLHFLLAGASIVLSSVFQALGNGVFSLIVSVCRQLFVLLPAAWLLAQTGNVNNVWWAFLIAEIVSVLLSLGFYARINKNIIAPMYSPAE